MSDIVEEEAGAEKPDNSKQVPELTLNDLNSIKNVIEVATQRGAFKAHELTSVGQVYDKLSSFLTSITKTAQKVKP